MARREHELLEKLTMIQGVDDGLRGGGGGIAAPPAGAGPGLTPPSEGQVMITNSAMSAAGKWQSSRADVLQKRVRELEEEQQEHVASEEKLKSEVTTAEVEARKAQRLSASLTTDLAAAQAHVEQLTTNADNHHEKLTGQVIEQTDRERDAAKVKHEADERVAELRGLVKSIDAEKEANAERCRELEEEVAGLVAGNGEEHTVVLEAQRKLSEARAENAALQAENVHMHDESHAHDDAIAARVADLHALQDERDQLKIAMLEKERGTKGLSTELEASTARLAHEKQAVIEANEKLSQLEAEMVGRGSSGSLPRPSSAAT